MLRVFRRGSVELAEEETHALCTSFAKKCSVSGHRRKLGTPSRSCRLDNIEDRLARGRRGRPFFLTPFETVMRDVDGICRERCGFVNAHLLFFVSA